MDEQGLGTLKSLPAAAGDAADAATGFIGQQFVVQHASQNSSCPASTG
jgi:hypothetical protein